MSDKLRNLLVRGASGVVLFGVVLGAAFLGYWGFGALMLLLPLLEYGSSINSLWQRGLCHNVVWVLLPQYYSS